MALSKVGVKLIDTNSTGKKLGYMEVKLSGEPQKRGNICNYKYNICLLYPIFLIGTKLQVNLSKITSPERLLFIFHHFC